VSGKTSLFPKAIQYSFPVFPGYITIGIAFGLFTIERGYPWYLALATGIIMFAGAGQFIAIGLFAAGTSLWEACLIQLVVNARHIAYGLSMYKRFRGLGVLKPYLVFSLTDETFALLSSLPEIPEKTNTERRLFMFYIAILNQSYWVSGSVIGAVIGALIPFEMKGISFALTALFIVLMIEQIKKIKKPGIFVLSAAAALLGVFLLPGNISLLTSLVLALLLTPLLERKTKNTKQESL